MSDHSLPVFVVLTAGGGQGQSDRLRSVWPLFVWGGDLLCVTF